MLVYRYEMRVAIFIFVRLDLLAALVWLGSLTSTDSGNLKNPIDISNSRTARLRPAVSSLNACPTSAL